MDFERLGALLERAAAVQPPDTVSGFLDRTCAGDSGLREELESLLTAQRKAGGFLEVPVVGGEDRRLEEGVGDWIGRYQLIETLGEGGCGVVYLADQVEPVRRKVALKVIKMGMDTKSVVARFEAERQALALMEHPGVAKVFDAGVSAHGRPFFVMEWVRGTRITEHCRAAHLSIEARLKLFIQVCHALQHAHQKGVIHRDIKPANILVTTESGTAVPKVIDFGIAKATRGGLTDKTIQTQLQQFMGTPAYMSPEQAAMDGTDVDTRSDIYSLGVLLYELLTGVTPFDGRELMASGIDGIRRTIREVEPVRPSVRRAQLESAPEGAGAGKTLQALASDLDWIVMKCLEKDRDRRYESADALALDVERHLANEPVLARPPSLGYRLRKAYRRNRVLVVSAAMVVVALLGGLGLSLWQANRARDERDRAREAQRAADRNAQEARRFSYAGHLNLAAQAQADQNLARVRMLLQSQRPRPGEEDLRDFEWRYLWEQARSRAAVHRELRPIPVYGAVFTPDGSKLLCSQLEGELLVLDGRSLATESVLTTNVADFSLSRDGSTLAVLRSDAELRLFDAPTFQERRVIRGVPESADLVLVSPDGGTVAVSSESQITLWNARTGQREDPIPIAPRALGVSAFGLSPDGRTFVTSDDRVLHLWDRATRTKVAEFPGHIGGAYSAAFSPDGKWLATGGWRDRAVRVWELSSGRPVAVFTNHLGWIGRMDFSPDSRTLASCSSDQKIWLWDLERREAREEFRGSNDEVWRVCFSPDGNGLVSGDRSGGISLWNTHPPAPVPDFLPGRFAAVASARDGRSLTTVTAEGGLQMWDAATLRETGRSSIPVHDSSKFCFSPDSLRLAVGGTNGVVRILEMPAGTERRTLKLDSGTAVRQLEFSGDGRRLAAANSEGLRVWDVSTGESLRGVPNPANDYWNITPLALSPDGQRLAFGSADLGLHLVDLASGGELRWAPEIWGVVLLTFSPDGRYLAGAGRNHQVMLWRASDGEPVVTLKSWRQAVLSLAFSPSSQRLAVGRGEGGIEWVDLGTAQEMGLFRGPEEAHWVGFSGDGNALIAREVRGLRLWRAMPWAEIAGEPRSR